MGGGYARVVKKLKRAIFLGFIWESNHSSNLFLPTQIPNTPRQKERYHNNVEDNGSRNWFSGKGKGVKYFVD